MMDKQKAMQLAKLRKMKPSVFIEKYFGIKLLNYQKYLADHLPVNQVTKRIL